MTRTRRFLGGLLFGYMNQALVTLVGLWLTAFLLGRLGQADYGLWLVATRILSYLLLLDFGVVALLPREVAFATGRAGGTVTAAHDLPQVVGRTWRIVRWQMPLVALAAVVAWLVLPEAWHALSLPLAVVLASFVLTFPLRVFQALLLGLQELAFLGVVHTVAWLFGTAATVGLVVAGYGLYALAIGWAVTQVVAGTLWVVRVVRRYPRLRRPAVARADVAELKDRLQRSGWVSVSQVAQVFLGGTDLLLIGAILGPEAVVPYFCTGKVLTVLGHQPQLLAQTAQPALSELRTAAARTHLMDVATALTRVTLLLSGAIVCVVLVVNRGFVTWWVGAEQFGGLALTATLLGGMLLRHWNVTAVYSLFAFGHDRRLSLTQLADGLVTVMASVVLIRAFGVLGAAIGALVGVVLVALPLNLAALAREMGVSRAALLGSVWPWVWRFVVVAALAAALAMVWTPATLVTLALATMGVTAVYAIVMGPFVLREPLGRYVRPRLEFIRRVVARDAALSDADA